MTIQAHIENVDWVLSLLRDRLSRATPPERRTIMSKIDRALDRRLELMSLRYDATERRTP